MDLKPFNGRLFINGVTFNLLFSTEKLDKIACFRINTFIGFILVVSGIMLKLIRIPVISEGLDRIWTTQIILGIPLFAGVLGLFLKNGARNVLLPIQGSVFILAVMSYTFFYGRFLLENEFSGDFMIGHAPGILAAGMAYGVKQIIDFSGNRINLKAARIVTASFFSAGAICDMFFVVLILRFFSTRA
ncbi:hypothetical protein JXA84_08320 [candidate division WOR-3 bacterium]|nr:hypothetical protein [candidate division WOR-3 bacterium]